MPTRLPTLGREPRSRQKIASRGPSVLRDINLRSILQLLRVHNPCSCSDLARYSGLSAPTVATSVAQLEHMGLAKRLGKGFSSGGRPPRLLSFNETYGYVAGIAISEGHIRVGIADLAGQLLGESTGEIGEKSWPMAVVECMVSLLAALQESLRIPAKRLLAVGVAAPGITDVDAGLVVSVPSMPGWENVPLGRLLAEKIRVWPSAERAISRGKAPAAMAPRTASVPASIFAASRTTRLCAAVEAPKRLELPATTFRPESTTAMGTGAAPTEASPTRAWSASESSLAVSKASTALLLRAVT